MSWRPPHLRGASTDRDDSITLALHHKHWRVASLLAGYTTRPAPEAGNEAERGALWLVARCAALPHGRRSTLDGMTEARARALLRAGADVHAAEAEEPGRPSPLDPRRRSSRAATPTPRPPKTPPRGSYPLVLGRDCSAITLFADAERKAATALVVAGALVGREHGGAQSHLLFELWVQRAAAGDRAAPSAAAPRFQSGVRLAAALGLPYDHGSSL